LTLVGECGLASGGPKPFDNLKKAIGLLPP
jgi:hypothetical protein